MIGSYFFHMSHTFFLTRKNLSILICISNAHLKAETRYAWVMRDGTELGDRLLK